MKMDYTVSLECRDLSHAWMSAGDAVLIEQQGQVRHFERRLRCERCETMRFDEYTISNAALARIRSRYAYPDGYRVPGGLSVAKARWMKFSQAKMEPLYEKQD
jgi:hypothetical protein